MIFSNSGQPRPGNLLKGKDQWQNIYSKLNSQIRLPSLLVDPEELAERSRSADGKAMAVSADVAKIEEVRKMVQEVEDAFGGTNDILVNSAGGVMAKSSVK